MRSVARIGGSEIIAGRSERFCCIRRAAFIRTMPQDAWAGATGEIETPNAAVTAKRAATNQAVSRGFTFNKSIAPICCIAAMLPGISREPDNERKDSLTQSDRTTVCGSERCSAQSKPLEMRWNELAPMIGGHHLVAMLTDGISIRGEVIAVRDEAMLLDVSSAVTGYAKGDGSIPHSAARPASYANKSCTVAIPVKPVLP